MSSETPEYKPEALLNRLYNAKTFDDVINLINDIRDAVFNTIVRAKADDYIKYGTLYISGMVMDAVYTLLDSYAFSRRIPLPFSYDLRAEIVRDLKDIIEIYANLMNGEPLEGAKQDFQTLLNLVRNDIANFYKNLEDYIKELRGHKVIGFSRRFTEF
jgi:hypothetical protein